MDFVDQANLMPYKCFNGVADPEGPKGMRVVLDFTAAGSAGRDILIDLQKVEEQHRMTIVQTLSIDNVDSGLNLGITAQFSLHRVVVPAGRQANLPIFAPGTSKFTATVSFGLPVPVPAAGLITMHFLSVPLPTYVW